MLVHITNPLICHYIGKIRDKTTQTKEFNEAIRNLVYLMAGDISKNFGTTEKIITTPIEETNSIEIKSNICLIPILRAGLALLEPMRQILPESSCGYMGAKRKYSSEGESKADIYFSNLPPNFKECKIYLLEVVLASGTTLKKAIQYLLDLGASAKNIHIVSLITCDAGIKNITQLSSDLHIYYCAKDGLRESDGYLVPGLGDAGDRFSFM